MTDRTAPPRRRRGQQGIGVGIALLVALTATACTSTDSRDAAGDPTAATSTQGASDVLLSPTEFSTYIAEHPDVPLVNVHIPYAGHIAGTTAFVPFDEILEWPDLPADREAPIAIYCRSGSMSGTAADQLAAAGYTDVVDLSGGMNAWIAAGSDLIEDDPTDTTQE